MNPLPARVRVCFDGEPVTIWSWARVRHALNWHSQDAYRAVLSGHKVVCDEAGQRADLDGALQDGARLLLRPAPNERGREDPAGVQEKS